VTHDQEEALSISDRVVVMNHAKIEQVGTPFEIYNFPRTRFVASFVGTLNTLQAEVVDPHAGLLRVGGQTVHAARSLADVHAGDRVALALRPELLSLDGTSEPAPGAENRLSGTLETVNFLGSIVRLQIRVGDSILLLDEFNNPTLALPTTGSAVTVQFGREACFVLDQAPATPVA